MFRFNSLQKRITAMSAAAFGVVLLLVALSTQWAISILAENKVRDEMASSSQVINRIWTMRENELASVARPLALDFGFREAVATDDDATIRSALENIASRIDLPNAFVVKYDGRVVDLGNDRSPHFDPQLWDELDSGWNSGALRIGDATYQAVAAQIRAPELIGWLVIGRKLDAAETNELSALSPIPVRASIVRRDVNGKWVQDASGEAITDPMTLRLLSNMALMAQNMPNTLHDSEEGKMILVRPLGTSNGSQVTALMLDFSIADAMAEYDWLRLAVLGAGLLGLVLVVLASVRIAQQISRPIAALEAAAQSLQRGERKSLEVQSRDEIGSLTASFNAMSKEIVERENRIRHMAYHDSLTNLPNRFALAEELDRALSESLRRGSQLTLLCVSIDNLNSVNDTLGHATGDKLIKAVAQRLTDGAQNHFVAHNGSDEFWLLLRDTTAQRRAAEELAQQLVNAMGSPFSLDGQLVRSSISAGLAFAPQDAARTADLIKHAELALHNAHEAGRGKVVHFTTDLDDFARERHALEIDLHAALANGEFELYFQPLFDLSKNRFSTFEALIRWNHPTRGTVSPVEFIPIAEETGMIVGIGEWVLKEACHQAVTWPSEIRVAVNFSTVQFNAPGLVNMILQSLAASGLAPNRLEVEITESLFLESSETILRTLNSLKDLGVRIALDDFGTGFSSLSYLRKYPFDKIKIDRSFIVELLENQEAGAVVQAITDLAAALNMETTAEGVEEDEQVTVLRGHGCTNVQGFLFSKPVPASEVLPLLGVDLSRHVA